MLGVNGWNHFCSVCRVESSLHLILWMWLSSFVENHFKQKSDDQTHKEPNWLSGCDNLDVLMQPKFQVLSDSPKWRRADLDHAFLSSLIHAAGFSSGSLTPWTQGRAKCLLVPVCELAQRGLCQHVVATLKEKSLYLSPSLWACRDWDKALEPPTTGLHFGAQVLSGNTPSVNVPSLFNLVSLKVATSAQMGPWGCEAYGVSTFHLQRWLLCPLSLLFALVSGSVCGSKCSPTS